MVPKQLFINVYTLHIQYFNIINLNVSYILFKGDFKVFFSDYIVCWCVCYLLKAIIKFDFEKRHQDFVFFFLSFSVCYESLQWRDSDQLPRTGSGVLHHSYCSNKL